MRISDWSSDVCASDLGFHRPAACLLADAGQSCAGSRATMTIDHFPQLDTARLALRGFRRTDEAAFAGFATHEEFWRFLPGPALDRELVARFVAARVADAETPTMRDWIFCVEEIGRAPV